MTVSNTTVPTVLETHCEALELVRRGKVRDIYDVGDQLVLVATDRISAFDVIIPNGIPEKGRVLTQLSAFWFSRLWKTDGLPPHHFLSCDIDSFPSSCHPYRDLLRGRSMLVRKATPLPVECIVRGYISGSGWREYCRQGTVCGIRLPGGLRESEQLPEPIFTPSTKSDSHDVNISYGEMQGIVGNDVAEAMRSTSLRLYQRAAEVAAGGGIIIADTKFEFGLDSRTQRVMLIDEVLTPDSSRFWPKNEVVPGRTPPSFDKQFVRNYLDSTGWDHTPPAPRLPADVVRQTSEKYLEILKRLTGV